MLIVMYVAVIFSKKRNKKQQQKKNMGMTTEIEKLMMNYSWKVEKSIFFNFIISSPLAFSINYSKLAA